MLITILSWTATCTTILTMVLLSKKLRIGWINSFIGCCQWFVVSVLIDNLAFLVLTVVLAIIAIKGYHDWSYKKLS